MTVTQKPKIKLTEHGKAVAEALKARKQEILEQNDGEYVPDPWYKRYLSPDFEIKQSTMGITDGYLEASAELGIDTDEVDEDDDSYLLEEDEDEVIDDRNDYLNTMEDDE